MKRILIVFACAAMCFCLACKQAEAPVPAEPTAEPTQTPEEPVVFEISPDALPAETVNPAGFTGLIISDGDVEITMEELADAGEFSVYPVEYDSQILYYVFPADLYTAGDTPDLSKAVGSVVMSYNADCVASLSAQVFLSQMETSSDQVQDLFSYFRDQFPMFTVIGVTAENWAALGTELDMNYETAIAAAQSGLESREIYGQFVYHVSETVVSFDFYAA